MEQFPDIKKKVFSLKTGISFVLAFIIIYLLVTGMDTGKVMEVIRNTSLSLYLLGFVIYYLAFPLRGLRFKIMLKNNECSCRLADLTRIIVISWSANCIAPAKLGDIFRAFLVRQKYCQSFTKTIGTVFAERVFDLFILYLLIGASGIMAFRGKIPQQMMIVLETSFFLLALVLAALIFMRYLGNSLAEKLPKKVSGMYQRFLAGTMSSFRNNWQITFLTVGIWFLEGSSFYLVTRAIGMELSFAAVLFIGLISALLTALPITPAGLGFVETAKVGVLIFFGIDRNIAVSAALLDRAINYWSLLLAGFIIYMATGQRPSARFRDDRKDDSSGQHGGRNIPTGNDVP